MTEIDLAQQGVYACSHTWGELGNRVMITSNSAMISTLLTSVQLDTVTKAFDVLSVHRATGSGDTLSHRFCRKSARK